MVKSSSYKALRKLKKKARTTQIDWLERESQEQILVQQKIQTLSLEGTLQNRELAYVTDYDNNVTTLETAITAVKYLPFGDNQLDHRILLSVITPEAVGAKQNQTMEDAERESYANIEAVKNNLNNASFIAKKALKFADGSEDLNGLQNTLLALNDLDRAILLNNLLNKTWPKKSNDKIEELKKPPPIRVLSQLAAYKEQKKKDKQKKNLQDLNQSHSDSETESYGAMTHEEPAQQRVSQLPVNTTADHKKLFLVVTRKNFCDTVLNFSKCTDLVEGTIASRYALQYRENMNKDKAIDTFKNRYDVHYAGIATPQVRVRASHSSPEYVYRNYNIEAAPSALSEKRIEK